MLLWLSPHAPSAASSGEAPVPQSAGPSRASLSIEALPSWTPGVASAYRISYTPPDDRIAAPLRKLADLLRTRTWQFNDSLLSLRGGVKLDLGLPDGGNLHLNLFPDQDDPERGRHWQLSSDGDAGPARLWSVGGSVEVINAERERGPHRVDTERQVVLTPQLMLDMDQLAGMPGNAQLTLQHCNWRDGVTNHHSDDKVWQLNVRWRF
ncbi:hypothetical protein [Fontimonas sp. SYSU GA230001]|uniref:hypothetical protein n=1 Tax=Fontimonas sp. SYSU GA230001 TaxID=3142450 RepID=UPI0032B4B377